MFYTNLPSTKNMACSVLTAIEDLTVPARSVYEICVCVPTKRPDFNIPLNKAPRSFRIYIPVAPTYLFLLSVQFGFRVPLLDSVPLSCRPSKALLEIRFCLPVCCSIFSPIALLLMARLLLNWCGGPRTRPPLCAGWFLSS